MHTTGEPHRLPGKRLIALALVLVFTACDDFSQLANEARCRLDAACVASSSDSGLTVVTDGGSAPLDAGEEGDAAVDAGDGGP